MASPQKEDGFAPIANEILEALGNTHLSPYEWQTLMCLFRKTYGWGKHEEKISLKQFEDFTKISRSHVCRTIKKLVKKKIITQVGNGYHVRYKYQKDYDKWLPKQAKVKMLPKQATQIAQIGNEMLPKQATALIKKERNIKKGIPPTRGEVLAYMTTLKIFNAPLETEKFFNHHEARGWILSNKQKMVNWKAACRTWKINKDTWGTQKGKTFDDLPMHVNA